MKPNVIVIFDAMWYAPLKMKKVNKINCLRDKHQSSTQPPMNHFVVPDHIHSCTVGCSYQVFVLLPSLVCGYSHMTHRSMMEHRRNHIRMMVADNWG